MLTRKAAYDQLPFVLTSTHFSGLGERYEGKVRDTYQSGDRRILITTDRLSCFDRVVTSIPFKGQVVNQIALNWFSQVQDIVPNHLLDSPHPNVMIAKNCKILPIEVVVRGFITGSAWRDYAAGRAVSGVQLPAGLRESEKLPQPILTPSTKAAHGSHDEPISEEEIIKRGIVDSKLWQEVCEVALALFRRGQEIAAKRGLLLVDTKYEFGLFAGRLVLADEIHTLDSSRYWRASTYSQRFTNQEAPEMVDKQPMRQWLLDRGFAGDGAVPEIDSEKRVDIALHYVSSYEEILGEEFKPLVGPQEEAIAQSLSGLR